MTDLQPAAPPVPGPDGSRPSATRRVRARLARRMTPQRVAAVPPVLEPLASVHRTLHPKADLALLTHAYEVAEAKHAGQKRKSGDPYITHPLAVSTILAELGMDTTTLVAALLHDTVEDTDYSLDRLREEFGDEVAHLVDGVTKLDKVEFGNAAEAETIRKMVVAMARDPRVLVIKLSDRLHNMRTMRFLSPEKQAKKARETLEVMAPLAHRLGMATVKWELEDLSFAILHPKRYSEIVRLVATRAPSRDTYLKQVIDEVRQQLDAARLTNVSVEGRPKHYYSIYRKMIVKGPRLRRHPRPRRRARARRRGARLLRRHRHGARAVAADAGAVQGLHRAAAVRGVPVAAHHGDRARRQAARGADPHARHAQHRRVRHRRALALQGDAAARRARRASRSTRCRGCASCWTGSVRPPTPATSSSSCATTWAPSRSSCSRPKGDVITLPAKSTPVDFAYAVHTEVGHRCIGSRVNGRLVRAGAHAGVRRRRRDLHVQGARARARAATGSAFVASPRAKTKIQQWFAKERREEAIEAGKEAIAREARRTSMPLQRLVSADAMAALGHELRFPDLAALYAAVGEGHASARHVIQRLAALLGGEEQAGGGPGRAGHAVHGAGSAPAATAGVVVRGHDGDVGDLYTKLARCCTPVPGDEILGFVTAAAASRCTGWTAPTRATCTGGPSASSTWRGRCRRARCSSWPSRSRRWTGTGCCRDITKVLADEKVNILSASVATSKDRVAISRFSFEMGDPKHLGHVLSAVRNVEGVYDVYRVTSAG